MSINIWDFNCEFDVKSVANDINYKYKNFSSQTNSLFHLPWFCTLCISRSPKYPRKMSTPYNGFLAFHKGFRCQIHTD